MALKWRKSRGAAESSRYEYIKLQECAVIAIIFFVRAARALLCLSSLELGGVGIYYSEDRRIFFDLSQISIILEHGFNVRAS